MCRVCVLSLCPKSSLIYRRRNEKESLCLPPSLSRCLSWAHPNVRRCHFVSVFCLLSGKTKNFLHLGDTSGGYTHKHTCRHTQTHIYTRLGACLAAGLTWLPLQSAVGEEYTSCKSNWHWRLWFMSTKLTRCLSKMQVKDFYGSSEMQQCLAVYICLCACVDWCLASARQQRPQTQVAAAAAIAVADNN